MKMAMNIKKLIITAAVAVIVVLIVTGGGHLRADPPEDSPGLEIAMEVQEAHTPFLMEDPDVVGTAVGLNAEGKPVIQVFVVSGQARGIPRSLEGFPVIE